MKDSLKCSKSVIISLFVLLTFIFAIVIVLLVSEHIPSFWKITIGVSAVGITLVIGVLFAYYLRVYKRLLDDYSNVRKQSILDSEKDNQNASLESRIEEAGIRINRLESTIKDLEYPLEKYLNPILAFLNDIYLECDEYGEQYARHIKKRVEFLLENQGYEYVDYSEDTIDYYSTFKSNYDTDTVTQPALVNKKTQRCVIGGIVFLKGEK